MKKKEQKPLQQSGMNFPTRCFYKNKMVTENIRLKT